MHNQICLFSPRYYLGYFFLAQDNALVEFFPFLWFFKKKKKKPRKINKKRQEPAGE